MLDDPRSPAGARRLVLSSGKVFYDLDHARQEAGQQDVALVRLGGFGWFSRAMGACVVVMFVVVVTTALAITPSWGAAAAGLGT